MSFLFFKQKTAYEMRISDWISDVCSSDLFDQRRPGHGPALGRRPRERPGHTDPRRRRRARRLDRRDADPWQLGPHRRSEEHTSELQSLMRISYAVFCLKKKNIRHSHKL